MALGTLADAVSEEFDSLRSRADSELEARLNQIASRVDYIEVNHHKQEADLINAMFQVDQLRGTRAAAHADIE